MSNPLPYVLLRHRDIPDLHKLGVYIDNGGFETFKKIVADPEFQPDTIVQIIKESGLRGRGGAGFPTGLKLEFTRKLPKPRYVVVNGDESEPGTFKDREILESNPFQFLEGVTIASYAMEADTAYIYLRGEFWELAAVLEEKISEMENAGYLGANLFGSGYSLRIHVHLGAGAYICGEETALLESLEGNLGQPRVRPPFPVEHGLYGRPTDLNNVETLTNIPMILAKGADWYKSMGTEDATGVKIFSLSGRVRRPGNYELPFGTTFKELIYGENYGAGVQDSRQVKAIMPAGASSSLILVNGDQSILETPMDYLNVRKLGAELGSASIIVLDDTVNIDWVISKTVNFFKHESCGKCTPCREGTYWMKKITERIRSGDGTQDDIDLLHGVATQMKGKSLCALGEFATMAVATGIERFPDDFRKAVKA